MADTHADPRTASIVILHPDPAVARQIAGWLRSAGLDRIATARTADEALFLLGRQAPALLIADERFPDGAEYRLLCHVEACGHARPAIVRLVSVAHPPAPGTACVAKPLDAHELVLRVGTALARPDLLGRMDRGRDQSAAHLAAARRMQLGLLPAQAQLDQLQAECGLGIAGFCRSGEAVGGDFWWAAQAEPGSVAVALADFAGHGLTAALNTFRLHAIMSEQALPRAQPLEMTALLNRRLHTLLPRGQYATMIYLRIDAASRQVEWCSAGGPPPLFVTPGSSLDLAGSGLPLGVRAEAPYRASSLTLPASGLLCLFSDGLYESGGVAEDVPRDEMAAALAGPAALAAEGRLAEAAGKGVAALVAVRDRHPCDDHSDDVMAVCLAL